jgi:Ca2+-binding EF-hand superfamily protein
MQIYRANIFCQRIRLREIFQDFDPLRSGLISIMRFRRCVTASMNKGIVSPLNAEEYEIMTERFRVANTDMVQWRSFVDCVDEGILIL